MIFYLFYFNFFGLVATPKKNDRTVRIVKKERAKDGSSSQYNKPAAAVLG